MRCVGKVTRFEIEHRGSRQLRGARTGREGLLKKATIGGQATECKIVLDYLAGQEGRRVVASGRRQRRSAGTARQSVIQLGSDEGETATNVRRRKREEEKKDKPCRNSMR